MSFQNQKLLKSKLRCPDTLGRIMWVGNRGFSFGGRRRIVRQGQAYVFLSPGLPADYDRPHYQSSNPYQALSLELIRQFPDGLVLDFGAGSPRHAFPNVCQVEIARYPGTDIVVAEGRLPLADGCVDAVLSQSVLEHVKDPFLYVSDMFRVLKPGGRVLVDAAFMQPLHGYPSHYFNMTNYALAELFKRFVVESLSVGPHQHPWLALDWILGSYCRGMPDQADQAWFRQLRVGELMDLLAGHQTKRAEIKRNEDPLVVATKLKAFNATHAESLGGMLRIGEACERELAAGFQLCARKP